MKMFIIRLWDGNYLAHVQIGSNYLNYHRIRDRNAAQILNNVDSELVLTRLRNEGEKNPLQEEIA